MMAVSALALASCGGEEGDENAEEKKEVVEEKVEVVKLSVNTEESHIWWHAWNREAPEDHKHMGKVRLSSGEVELTNGELTSGSATINLASMFESDLEEGKGLENLIGHLMSPDFFGVDSTGAGAPTVTVNGYSDGMINATLTIAGTSNDIQVPATVENGEDMVTITSDKFTLDFTNYGMPYFVQEGKEPQGDRDPMYLNPEVEFEIHIVANK